MSNVRDSPDPRTFAQFAEEYLRWSRGRHTTATHDTLGRLLRGTVLPHLGLLPLVAIDRNEIERLLELREHWSPATRNRILSAVSALYRRAQALGYVTRNPAAGIERARERMIPIPLVSLAVQDALIDELPLNMRPLFVTAQETGARLGELLRLRWADIDLPHKTLQIGESKSGRPRLIRMSRRLEAMLFDLQSARETTPGGLLFAEAVGADDKLRWRWRRAFKRAAAAVGLPELRIHDLRHLHAVALVRAGVDLPTVQAQLGHRHLVSTLRYAAYADESASARAARALDGMREGDPRARRPS